MRLRWLAAAAALPAISACGFPPVTASADPAIERQARLSPVPGPSFAAGYAPGQERPGQLPMQQRGEPREVVGMVESNAVSSMVIESDGSRYVVQVTPQTQLRIGDRLVGLREIQPGSEVRATFVPVSDQLHLALEVAADPEIVGWSARRAQRVERREIEAD